MARFLIAVPPLVGHVNPTVPVGVELARRGHDVVWVGHSEVVADLLPPGARFMPVADAAPPELVAALDARLRTRQNVVSGFRSLWEEFVIPMARHMRPGVERAADDVGPDVVVADVLALAGVAVAEARGIPWVTTMTTPADLVDPLAGFPKLAAWLRTVLTEALVDAGVEPERATVVDPRYSPHLVLAFTSPQLVLEGAGTAPVSDNVVFVGASLDDRPDEAPFPWGWLDGARRSVLVTLGTVNWRSGSRFFATAVETLADMDVHGVVVAPPDSLGLGLGPKSLPPNVVVRERVPQLALLRRMDAVVCHAGHNTVCESLAHGVPLVLAAIRDDQPFVAEQVARLGAGVRVRFSRLTVPELRKALDTVLTDPDMRAEAARVGAALRQAGGPPTAADHLEKVAAGS